MRCHETATKSLFISPANSENDGRPKKAGVLTNEAGKRRLHLLFFFLALFAFVTVSGQNEFITTWQATSNAIIIPVNTSGTYNYTVRWEEIGNAANSGTIVGATGSVTITTANTNQYKVTISGTYPEFSFSADAVNAKRLLTVEEWGSTAWTSMEQAFLGCSNLTIPATDLPNLTNVTNMRRMFQGAENLVVNRISDWDVSHVITMEEMFQLATHFTGDLSAWNVSSVTNMGSMFLRANSFNSDLSGWATQNVTNMSFMFNEASSFSSDISTWDVSHVTDMRSMFRLATSFNSDIGLWDVSQVVNMFGMFFSASAFNADISQWDVGNVTNMASMFDGAVQFNQDLGQWNINKVSAASLLGLMLRNSGLSIENYDKLLNGWTVSASNGAVTLGANGLKYCAGESGRNALLAKGWTITGDSKGCPFITTWQATGNTITIPTMGTGFNYNIFWEEIGNTANNGSATGVTGDHTIPLPNANQYRIKISGSFPRLHNGKLSISDRQKLLTVEQWGDISWTSMYQAFFGCNNLVISATDAPDLSNVTTLQAMFQACTGFNSSINHWDVSTITNMAAMFYGAYSFNQDLSSWDVSNVTDMTFMFMEGHSFNQDISGWDVSNVKYMGNMFVNSAFNQDIGNWDLSSLISISGMFQGATSFNQDISMWDVSRITSMAHTFYGATSFNQNIGTWDVTKVSNMTSMLDNTGLSRENYDLTLTGWASKNVLTGVSLGSSGLKYCDGETARNTLISTKGWTITGDVKYCPQAITFNTLADQVYGDVFTLSATSSSGLPITFASSDPTIATISGNTITALGVGTVTITASQDGNVNYETAISEQRSLTIDPKPVTITVEAGQAKVYGEADPVFTYSADPALIAGDVFTGSLARNAGENVGPYSINQNTLTTGSNYTITFVGDNFTITPKAITLTADPGQTKIYGNPDLALTYTLSTPLIGSDALTGAPARAVGQNAGDYAINQGTLDAGGNYQLSFVSNDFIITPKTITITADPGQHKSYGEADPQLTYSINPSLIAGDVITGSLAREPGEAAGSYAIHVGTLDAGSNYTITFQEAVFLIRNLTQSIVFNDLQEKAFGEQPFSITATASSGLPVTFTSSDDGVASIQNNTVTINGAGMVVITAYQDGNEMFEPAVPVTRDLIVRESNLFIPTLFSPDGNGVNETFIVHGAGIREIQLVIYNNVGREVFRTTDVDIATRTGWDGSQGNRELPAGTYAWSLQGRWSDGSPLSFKGKNYGQIVLIR